MAKLNVGGLHVGDLGEYIRDQRRTAQISLRQLAKLAGVSNPYLSQIERGLRRPSAEILQQIAKALRISAEALYVQAGILEERYPDSTISEAILTDLNLTERQKHVLLEIYESFRRENGGRVDGTPAAVSEAAPTTQRRRPTRPRRPTEPAGQSSPEPPTYTVTQTEGQQDADPHTSHRHAH